MKRKYTVCIGFFAILAAVFLGFTYIEVRASSNVYVDPSQKIVLVGDVFTVNVTVDYAANLYAYQFNLSWTPTKLNCTDAYDAGYLNPPIQFWAKTISNNTGSAYLSYSSQGAVAGKTGGGIIAYVSFKALVAGNWTLHLSDVILVDDQTNEIPSTTTDALVVVNTPPVASNLAITPANPYTTDNLNAGYTYYDADGNPESGTEIRWYKNTVLQPLLNDTKIVPWTLTNKTQTWYFTVKPKDGMHFGTLQTSPSVTIQNSPPTTPVVDVTPNLPKTDDDLTCTVTTASTDPDGDSINYIYAWYKNGAWNQSTTKAGLTDTLAKAKTTKGEVWNCTVTPTDGTVNGTSASDQVTILNSPPTAPTVDVTPNLPLTTQDLTCTVTVASTDPDSDTVYYKFEWYKNSVLQSAETTNTTGLTDIVSNLLTTKGENWTCVVTPGDGALLGSSASDQVIIQNSAPTAPTVAISPHSPITTDDLNCTVTAVSTDPDSDTVYYKFEWYKNGALQSAETTNTTMRFDIVSNTLTSDGENWTCVVTPGDGALLGSSASDQVIIGAPNLVIDSIIVQNQGCNVYANDTYQNTTAYYVPVEVKVKNVGIVSATAFNVSLSTYWINGSVQESIVEWRVLSLNPGENTTLTYYWHPTHTGYYNLTAVADCHNEITETNEGDNSLVLASYPVAVMGDIKGDHAVNILDASVISLAWGTSSGETGWNIKADLNHDGTINILDGVRVTTNWGKTW